MSNNLKSQFECDISAMAIIWLGVFILANVFADGLCQEYEVHYEVNDYDELAEASFKLSHGIAKRAAMDENITSTASPSTSVKTTPIVMFNSKTSFINATSRTTGHPTGHRSGNHTDQPTGRHTGHPTGNGTGHPIRHPTTHPTTRFPTPSGTTAMNNTNATAANTTVFQDNHKYYKSQYFESGDQWWFDLNKGSGTPNLHVGLSKNLLYSDTIETSFKFPYYGHEISDVTITNKGFLFLGETVHKFNASMQYVAPIMANFGAHLHKETSIHYVDTGDRFTVQWENLRLQNQSAGEFSFQCSILKNGTIVFAYKNVPVSVGEIKNEIFPVRVGLSDSLVIRYIHYGPFIINGRLYTAIRYKVYYRYHQVKLPQEQVKNGSAFVMTPLPNCILYKSCDSCVKSQTQFSCRWCPKLQRCSDGIDRHRHSWLVNRCDVNSKTTCSGIRPGQTTPTPTRKSSSGKGSNFNQTKSRGGSSSNKRAGMVVLVVFIVFVVIAIACWVAYAYTHPLSKSGMFLMQYGNPRKWCRNSGRGSSGVGKISFKSMSANDSTA